MTRLFEAKPFIICEVGSNWTSLNHCIQSIGQAKAVGADAVKFQAFDHEALYGMWEWQRPDRLPHSDTGPNPLTKYELPLDWLPILKEKADACGIELMCTAFSPELVEAVDPFVTVHKVASSDLSYPQLLEAVARTGKPALLSTGASNEGDIRAALEILPGSILLYCVAAYPALHVDLMVMKKIGETFDVPVGFSDHSPGIALAVDSERWGAEVLEKHFTAFPELDTPDRPHSLTVDEFRTMVEYIRGVRTPKIGPTPEEKAMLLRHNRRLIATRDVATGELLKFDQNYGAYRSLVDDTRGLSPFAWQTVEGKAATRDMRRGEAIGPGDFG